MKKAEVITFTARAGITVIILLSLLFLIPWFQPYIPGFLSNLLIEVWAVIAILNLFGCYLAFRNVTRKSLRRLLILLHLFFAFFYVLNILMGMPTGNL